MRFKVLTKKIKNFIKPTNLLYSQLGITVISILISTVIIIIMSLLFKSNPVNVFFSLFEGSLKGKESIASTLTKTIPLILAGLAVFLPYQVGFYNIGGQGQIQIGALITMIVVLNLNFPPLLTIFLALIMAFAGGILLIILPLILKLNQGVNEVTTTIMINFAGIELVYAMITGIMQDPNAFYGTTFPVPDVFVLPELTFLGINVHLGVWIVLLITILIFILLKYTVFGYKLNTIGLNKKASRVAGISVKKIYSTTVLIGGGFAGLAGGIQVLGVVHRVAEGWAMNWGFTGITVAILAGSNPLAIIPVSFFLAILDNGGRYMQSVTGVPSSLVYIYKGLPVLIFVIFQGWKYLRKGK